MDWKTECVEKIDNNFGLIRALVIGDVMVDEYVTGRVHRVSPEAPVPVLEYCNRSYEAGGASNVAHNLAGLGADVSIMGVAADDEAGTWLRNHFAELGINTTGLIKEDNRATTLKTRFATKGQQLLRMDRENIRDISDITKGKIEALLENLVNDIDLVIISDYKKGVLVDATFVSKIIRKCSENNIKIAVDSKSRNIEAFANADFVKPNNIELEDVVGFKINNEDDLNRAGEAYLNKSGAKALVVTRGADGISLFDAKCDRKDYSAADVQVFDVCGAGDTVISTMSMAIASGLELEHAARMANYAAGIVICKKGTVAITSTELKRAINEK